MRPIVFVVICLLLVSIALGRGSQTTVSQPSFERIGDSAHSVDLEQRIMNLEVHILELQAAFILLEARVKEKTP